MFYNKVKQKFLLELRNFILRGDIMNNPILEQIENQKQKNYNKAFEDVVKAFDSFEKLDEQQKIKFFEDISKLIAVKNFFEWAKKYYR